MGSLALALTRSPSSLPPLFGGLVQLALALFLVVKHGERRVRLAFAATALASGTWALAAAIGFSAEDVRTAERAARVAFLCVALTGPCALLFAEALTRARSGWALPSVLAALAVGGAIAIVPGLARIAPRSTGGFYPTVSPAVWMVMAAQLPPTIYALAIVRRAARALPPCRRRRQLAWAWAALALGAVGGFDVRTVFSESYPLAWATGALSCAALYYAVVQHRLMAIRTLARQTVLGLVGSLVAGLGICAAVLSGRGVLNPAIVALAVFAMFVAMRVWVSSLEPQLARIVGRRRRALDRAWSEFERRSLDARSPDDVKTLLERALRDGLDVELRELMIYEAGRFGDPGLIADAEAALVSLRAPALRDLLEHDDERSATLRTALDALAADALVPLDRDGLVIGLMVLSGAALTPADDELADELTRLGAGAARAWMNARMYEEVARRQTGLETEVQRRTAELERALADLKGTQAQLVEAERSSSLGLLVAGISHEINNALNFISANLPTLARYAAAYEALLDRAERAGVAPGGTDADAVAAARAGLPVAIAGVEGAIRRISAIVGDLRKFARPDAERRLVRVEEGLDAAINLLRRRTDGRIDVARLYVGQPSVEGYPGPLNQCFFNLLLNAVEAAREEVWVVLRSIGEGGRGEIELRILDDGPGVEPALRDQVFQPFFTTKPKAAGLGLTVSRGIIERHGGTLALDSEPGLGARVTVRLPAEAPLPSRGDA
ncbi:MAG TPA: ATP-binding protein [Polyangia bacterium]|nr:ATP-binding protein [Polyangia bacterium]